MSQTRILRQILDGLNEMKKILAERLSKKIGKGSKSDLDTIIGNMAEVTSLQNKHEQTLATIQTDLILLSNLMDNYITNGRKQKTSNAKRSRKSRSGKSPLLKSTPSTSHAPVTSHPPLTSHPVPKKPGVSRWANVAKLSSQIKARASSFTAVGMGGNTQDKPATASLTNIPRGPILNGNSKNNHQLMGHSSKFAQNTSDSD